MSERTKLLKKAVLTSVGATNSGDRIKAALNEVMQDLVKVGQELLGELEVKGKIRTESANDFIKRFQHATGKRTVELEKKVSATVHSQVKKAAKEFGLVTAEEANKILARLKKIEETVGVKSGNPRPAKKGRRRK